MKELYQKISSQKLTNYLWPDVMTNKGKLTGLFEGACVSLVLAFIYGVHSLLLFKNGVNLPGEVQEFVDNDLYYSTKMTLNLVCVGTALYYVRSILKNQSRMSLFFLLVWTFFEVFSEYSSGLSPMFLIYSLLLLGAINGYRSVQQKVILS